MKPRHLYFIFGISVLLSACEPHPGAGVWSSQETDNKYGTASVVVSYDGRAEFRTRKPEASSWHCFWSATGSRAIALQCTSSIKPDDEQTFELVADGQGHAELHHDKRLVARLIRKNENPVLK